MPETQLLLWLICAWPVAGVALFALARRARLNSVGLPFAYFIGWALIHWPGASLYLIPDHSYYDYDVIVEGFTLTTMGLGAYCLGVFLGGRGKTRSKAVDASPAQDESVRKRGLHQSAIVFLAIGFASQLILMPLLGQVASLTALLSGIATLSVTGVCLGLHEAYADGNGRRIAAWAFIGSLFPLITLTSSAFLGFGTYSLVVVVAFMAMHVRASQIRMAVVLLVPAVFMAMSLYVTYMRDRAQLRETVWYQEAGENRVAKIAKLFTEFEFLDLENPKHLQAIDQRLNQNHLVGSAQSYLVEGNIAFSQGESILTAFAAIIPRVLWPGKPEFGGSGSMVSEYTGLMFAEGTSVGAGQVLELYINFGTWGVVIGFAILGLVIRQFDLRAARGLRHEDYRSFLLWFVPGLGLLQAGGNLAEVVSSVAASLAAGLAAAYIVQRRLAKRTQKVGGPRLPRRAG